MVYTLLWKIHAILMSVASVSMLSGIFISIFYRKRKWRYITHKRLGLTAGITGIAAFLVAVIMVQIYSGAHFYSLHTISGGITTLLLVLTPLLGLRIMKAANKKTAKTVHRTFGWITAAGMLLTIFLGLRFTGII